MFSNRAKSARKMPKVTTADVAGVVSIRLRQSSFAPGKLARRVDAHPRAMKNWWDGENAPPAAYLVRLMAECRELEADIFDMVRRLRGDIPD
jgi:hypothetical protein